MKINTVCKYLFKAGLIIGMLVSSTALAHNNSTQWQATETYLKQQGVMENTNYQQFDYNDPRVKTVVGALKDVLEKQDIARIDDYFAKNAVIVINNKVLKGKEALTSRLKWIKENVSDAKITVTRVFFKGNHGFDTHISEAIDRKSGQKKLLKVFGYIELQDGKIVRYEDCTISLQEEKELAVATSTADD